MEENENNGNYVKRIEPVLRIVCCVAFDGRRDGSKRGTCY